MRVYIFGAAGSGVTTLGKALAKRLNHTYLDSDDYLWEQTNPPYIEKRDKQTRNIKLKNDILKCKEIVLGGSIISWDADCLDLFDLSVFLYLPSAVRLRRLERRELLRYGNILIDDPMRSQQFKGFLNWASRYDADDECGRGLPIHEKWLAETSQKVLEIREDTTVEERINKILPLLHDFL